MGDDPKCQKCGAAIKSADRFQYQRAFECGTVEVAASGGRWEVSYQATACQIAELRGERDKLLGVAQAAMKVVVDAADLQALPPSLGDLEDVLVDAGYRPRADA